MEKNFTPLKIDSLYKEKSEISRKPDGLAGTIFLFLATLTALVICIVLFLLIQKNINKQAGTIFILPVISSMETRHG